MKPSFGWHNGRKLRQTFRTEVDAFWQFEINTPCDYLFPRKNCEDKKSLGFFWLSIIYFGLDMILHTNHIFCEASEHVDKMSHPVVNSSLRLFRQICWRVCCICCEKTVRGNVKSIEKLAAHFEQKREKHFEQKRKYLQSQPVCLQLVASCLTVFIFWGCKLEQVLVQSNISNVFVCKCTWQSEEKKLQNAKGRIIRQNHWNFANACESRFPVA